MPTLFIDDKYVALPADFDGSTGYLSRSSDFTGNADSSTGILSVWLRLDGGNGSSLQVLFGTGSVYSFQRNTSNVFSMYVKNAAGTGELQFNTVGTYTSGASWIHVLASWNTNFGAGSKLSHLYINGVSDKTVTSDLGAAFNVDYTVSNHLVGSQTTPPNAPFNGCMAELYFAPGQFLDFSVAGNRSKFRDILGKPAFLGMDGSLPTGVAPLVFLRNPAATFEINSGTGGNYTRAGTISTGSTSPTL